jgi:DNA-binding MarR family transcriptional regulator
VDRTQSVTSDLTPQLTKTDYERLANLRYALRRFSRQTELEARRAGLTPQQYLLLLSLKGFPGRDWASITELAERLQIRHNAVIGLVNRAEERDLVRRAHDPSAPDRRIVNIHITPAGERILNGLSAALRSERQRVRLALEAVDQGQ